MTTPKEPEEKKINEMDSEEFIAHLFYNVFGGLHANSEEDAREGILEMIQDLKQSVSAERQGAQGKEREELVHQVEICEKDGELNGKDFKIQSLEAEVQRLREALEPFSNAVEATEDARKNYSGKCGEYPIYTDFVSDTSFERAKVALSPQPDKEGK